MDSRRTSDQYRRDSRATTVAHSRDQSRGSKTGLTGDHVGFGSRPSTAQYARDFAHSQFESSTTLQDSPTSPSYPPIRGLDGKLKNGHDGPTPEEMRSKGTTAVIMTALCVRVIAAHVKEWHANISMFRWQSSLQLLIL